MLAIQTFDARQGGNVLYKALTHPLAAEGLSRLAARLGAGPLAVYDPDGTAEALYALAPDMPRPAEFFVHDVQRLGASLAGVPARPVTELGGSGAATLLVASFEAGRMLERLRAALPEGCALATLDEAKLPEAMLTRRRPYLDRLNFATNLAFFREQDGLSTRLVTANYWSGYGAGAVRLWCRLFGPGGEALAEWEQAVEPGASTLILDSREVRERFALREFTGQLFVHAIGAAGHDVVKYAVDTYGDGGNEKSLSVTHDANAWPSERYAGLPAPRPDERVVLWMQNSHAAPIPAGAVEFDRMGAERPVVFPRAVPGFATVAVDVAEMLPGVSWPAQVEVRSGRHFVRPRYEVTRDGRTRIAHMNVERADLRPNPEIPSLSSLLGRGYILPFPVLDPKRFRSIVQPTPMAERQANLPLRLDVFDASGTLVAERFLGCLARDHDLALDVAELTAVPGHAELAYDFRDGGEADGWMHALMRYEDRESGHAAETSFGAHVFNTAMTYRDEPQSYAGPPPGLSTRLFLKLGHGGRRSFAWLIYAASAPWHPVSSTTLVLHDATGAAIDEQPLAIACHGSALVRPDLVFGAAMLERAGERGWVLVRDTTCRLFGYHGVMDDAGGFSLDHMFGF